MRGHCESTIRARFQGPLCMVVLVVLLVKVVLWFISTVVGTVIRLYLDGLVCGMRGVPKILSHTHTLTAGSPPRTVYAQSLQRGLQYITYGVNSCATAQITLVISHT